MLLHFLLHAALSGGDNQALAQEQWLRQEALQCLASATEALLAWYRQSSGQGVATGAGDM